MGPRHARSRPDTGLFQGKPFTERLPPEVRMRIYREVLQTDGEVYSVKCRGWHNCQGGMAKRLDTSLFAVSRLVHVEANDAFFEVNIVTVSSSAKLFWALDSCVKLNLAFVRRLEVHGIDQFLTSYKNFGDVVLRRVQQYLPKCRSLTVAYDDHEANISSLLSSLNIGGSLETMDVGLHRLVDTASAEVFFKHFTLHTWWRLYRSGKEARAIRVLHDLTIDDRVKWRATLAERAEWSMGRGLTLSAWCVLFDDWSDTTFGEVERDLRLSRTITERQREWLNMLREAFRQAMANCNSRRLQHETVQDLDLQGAQLELVPRPRLLEIDVQRHGQAPVRWVERLLRAYGRTYDFGFV